ncbi:MAG: RDD family protein [Bdellovibrionota bacterium]
MRCPDCGFLLLDPKSHCPKCEKTLQEKLERAMLASSDDPAVESVESPPVSAETPPSVEPVSEAALSVEVAVEAEPASAPQITETAMESTPPVSETAPSVEAPSVSEPPVMAVTEESAGQIAVEAAPTDEPAPLAAAAMEESAAQPPVETPAPKRARKSKKAAPPRKYIEPELFPRQASTEIPAAAAIEEPKPVVEVPAPVAEEIPLPQAAMGETTIRTIVQVPTASLPAEEPSAITNVAREEVQESGAFAEITGIPIPMPESVQEFLPEPPAPPKKEQLPSTALLRAQMAEPSIEESLADLSISLSGERRPVSFASVTESEIEDATTGIFNVPPAAPPEKAKAKKKRGLEENPLAAREEKISPEPLRPAAAKPVPIAPVARASTPPVDEISDWSYSEFRPDLVVGGLAAPPKISKAEKTLIRGRPLPEEKSAPSLDRFATTGWVTTGEEKAGESPDIYSVSQELAAEAFPPAPVAAAQPGAPLIPATQISFPDFREEEATGTADYPTAEIVGDASTRHSMRLKRGKPTLKGKALGRKLIAFGVDNALTFSLAVIFLLSAHLATGAPVSREAGGPGWIVTFFIAIALRGVIDACYQIGCMALMGKTYGESLMGLQVLGEGNAPKPTLAQAARRWAWEYALTFGICWGYLTCRRDRDGRAIQDLKSGTKLVPAG